MIHSLFHLDSPSVTVVVRTQSAPVLSPQLTYERSGLAYDRQVRLGRAEKVLQLLCMLWASDHPQRLALSQCAISGLDAHSAARIILAVRSHTPAGTQGRLIDFLAARDSELAALLRETVSRAERDRLLVDLRRQTRSSQHRMLLALVLNLPDRAAINFVLRQVAPDQSPENWLWDTLRSMHATSCETSDRRNVLGFSLNEESEQALKMLIRGHSVDEVCKQVAGHDDLAEDVRLLCSTLSALPVLTPLFSLSQK